MRNRHKMAVLALTVSGLLLNGSSFAQGGFGGRASGGAAAHGAPPSVTSFGFGGHPGFHGNPASVNSLNFGRAARGAGFGFHPRPAERRRYRNRQLVYPYFGGGYYLPYGYDYDYDDSDAAAPGPDDSGPAYGPVPHPYPRADDYRAELNSQPQAPVSDQPETVLVFRDGHQQEIKNYAIVGATLYDLSDGRTHKVQLAELDLGATVKQNDDRGITFQLPAGTKLN